MNLNDFLMHKSGVGAHWRHSGRPIKPINGAGSAS